MAAVSQIAAPQGRRGFILMPVGHPPLDLTEQTNVATVSQIACATGRHHQATRAGERGEAEDEDHKEEEDDE